MKYLIDSHIALWYLEGNLRLKQPYKHIIDQEENEILISSVSIWEIAIKFSIGKLNLNGSFDDFLQLLEENNIKTLNYTTQDVSLMSKLPFHHQDPFDRLIIAQAIQQSLPILSDDDKFKLYAVNLV